MKIISTSVPPATHGSTWIFLFLTAFLLGCGGEAEVDTLRASRGEIRESFSEPARTRLEKFYPITMHVQGRIHRIDFEPGDPVEQGQELVQYDLLPFQQRVAEARAAVAELAAQIVVKDNNRLEETAMIETAATIRAASEALKASGAQVQAETARSQRADKELKRMRQLNKSEAIARSELDDAELDAETALIELRRQEFYRAALQALVTAVHLGPRYVHEFLGRKRLERQVLVEQLTQAEARLALAEHDLAMTSVRSPIDGVVLARYEQGDSTLPAGQPLLLLGNLDAMEVIAEVLTQDAMRLTIGTPVFLEPAARLEPLSGKVKKIEPAGFTKLSSLGVEQQRVNVIVSLDARPPTLGVGYRLQARFLTGSKQEALIVPRFSVLQAPDQSYYTFKVEAGRLKKQPVRLGLRSDLELEIVEGLSEGDVVVSTPDTTLEDDMKVTVRAKE